MIRSFLGAVPPLRPAVRGFANASRTTDAAKASVAAVYDASEVAATIPGFEFPSAWCEDEVKDTPYAKRVAEPPVSMWALPSVAALHDDLERLAAIHAEAELAADPPAAFAPISVAALHDDFARLRTAEEDQVAAEQPAPNAWAMPSVAALHADIQLMHALSDETPEFVEVAAPAKNPFAPRSISAIHEDLAVMQAIHADLNVVPEVAGQMQACVPPAFAPASIAALHRDLALVHALSEADAKATAASTATTN